jgi:two-component system secretion sensor histidine kinase SsrA
MPLFRLLKYVGGLKIMKKVSEKNLLWQRVLGFYQGLGRRAKQTVDVSPGGVEQTHFRKSEHIANIGHEIRTPMNSIVGALVLLQRSELTAEQQGLVETATMSSDYLLSLINNILDYNQIELGKLELTYELVPLLPLLDKVMMAVRLRAEEKGLTLSAWVANDIPAEIMMSRIRVKQVLINLLGNAIKFTQRGYVKLHVEVQDERLVFAIEDSGEGIDESQHQQIFRPFVQVSAHSGGNGLGLTISSMLAQSMGGDILLSSQLGQGARFTFWLPDGPQRGEKMRLSGEIVAPAELHPQLLEWGLTPVEGMNHALASHALSYLPGRLWRTVATLLQGNDYEEQSTAPLILSPWSLKVLIVDDVAANLEVLSKILRDLGHQVDAAHSGQEALYCGREGIYDMILMDLRMPEMDGFTTAQRWRAPESGMLDEDTPIVALTADALSSERERVMESGMHGYLTKPLQMPKLMEVIENVVMLQLTRGIELMRNPSLGKPLIDVQVDEKLRDEIWQTFKTFANRIEQSWLGYQQTQLLESLHAIKGCAGLCGYLTLHDHCAKIEEEVIAGDWPDSSRIQPLIDLLRRESFS